MPGGSIHMHKQYIEKYLSVVERGEYKKYYLLNLSINTLLLHGQCLRHSSHVITDPTLHAP